MAHTDIARWLAQETPDWKQGKYLLDTYGRGYKLPFPPALLDNKSSFSERKLREALAALNERVQTAPSESPAPRKEMPRHAKGKTQGYPQHLVEIDRSLAVEWSELNHLANKKHELPEGPELETLALEIVTRYRELRHKWKQLDYYAAYGVCMPGTEPQKDGAAEIVATLCEWLQIQPAYIDYTRRYRKSKDPAKRKEAARRQTKLDEIAEYLKERLNADR